MQDISLHILDLSQNSIAAMATCIKLDIQVNTYKSVMLIRLEDNGLGMSESELASATDPFYTTRTKRKVGLGIPLFKFSAEATGGYLNIKSFKHKGTLVEVAFYINHIDCPPLGKIEDTIVSLLFCNPDIHLQYTHTYNDKVFKFDSFKIKSFLGEIPINDYKVILWIRNYLSDNLNIISGGAQNEIFRRIRRNKE